LNTHHPGRIRIVFRFAVGRVACARRSSLPVEGEVVFEVVIVVAVGMRSDALACVRIHIGNIHDGNETLSSFRREFFTNPSFFFPQCAL
jgi:hypothetical protein